MVDFGVKLKSKKRQDKTQAKADTKIQQQASPKRKE